MGWGRHLAHPYTETPCSCWTLRSEETDLSSSKPGWTLHPKPKAWPQKPKAKMENKSHSMWPDPTETEKSTRSEHPEQSQYVKWWLWFNMVGHLLSSCSHLFPIMIQEEVGHLGVHLGSVAMRVWIHSGGKRMASEKVPWGWVSSKSQFG